MDRQFLVQEIKRLANEDSGTPPGQEKFHRETGVSPAQWRGVYWAKWSDALAEAGFKPNSFNVAYEQDFLLEQLATAARDLQKFPTTAELKLYARGKAGFPTKTTFESRFKKRRDMIRALNNFCERHTDWSDVLNICRSFTEPERKTGDTEKPSKPVIKGHVYLMRSGKYYKIGKSKHVGGREYQIGLKLPEEVKTLHSIVTDDPDGIEAYWHKRFEEKRAEGEWFALTSDDIKAFKLRKFMQAATSRSDPNGSGRLKSGGEAAVSKHAGEGRIHRLRFPPPFEMQASSALSRHIFRKFFHRSG